MTDAIDPTDSTDSPVHEHDSFVRRHVGTDTDAQRRMLELLGYETLDEMLEAAVPRAILLESEGRDAASEVPAGVTEPAALAELEQLADRNTVRRSLIGLGYHGTHTPAVIQRNVLENPAWYTAYTPYQPEISQGRLEALLTFQTMICDLTGMDVSNASTLDEASSAAEALMLARRTAKRHGDVFLVDADALPATKAVLRGRTDGLGIELREVDFATEGVPDGVGEGEYFGALIQYPGASGRVWDPSEVIAEVRATKAVAIVATDLLSLTMLSSPGTLGADVTIGSSQRFGIPLGFGGPHAGFVAVCKGLERQLPGRLVGVSVDADGNSAYRLSLQTREQHIRREKATSSITTAQVLLAVMAAMYAVYHGPEGLTRIGRRVADRTASLADHLVRSGFELAGESFFDTLEIRATGLAQDIAAAAAEAGYLVHTVGDDLVHLSLDETVTDSDLRAIAAVLDGFAPDPGHELAAVPSGAQWGTLARQDPFLRHPVFSSFRSETAMMRYLRRLADRDFALDRGMIPLGSCTMKLNAATEMAGISWAGFNAVHPFAPREDVTGYLELITQLETWLADLTGYDTVSLQPNAGSQGEFAGLLAIRAYHSSRGESGRQVCLVPSSAHGTNAASAVNAGLRVVVVDSDARGNIDLDDLKQKIKDHGDELAALMITYPSTHGVYEEEVRTVCQLVHDAGGQVYVDGANLNALLQVARPGEFGGDVSHLNLHKTFCIPHGGGGPGVGPVAAKAHLAPFLPGHPAIQQVEHPVLGQQAQPHGGAPVAQAPYGSPSILPISWTYIRLMGPEGLRHATASAVLAANYMARRLAESYEILYTGENDLVAHECIVDLRPFTARTGITVDDVAKRLIDYGFHAPTMSFPVAGTFMIEPTESEDLAEIDRFVDAMLMIAAEAEEVVEGAWPKDDNPLVNAPHTAASIATGEWTHPYSREVAVYPGSWTTPEDLSTHDSAQMRIQSKYWPPVRRIDQAHGDRNLVPTWPVD
ncbi:aminomethyl-transferring glycine dehydrogenase [Brachybacterium sacelli]|uniref:Glycine dehydrogenase (decarboxylating) n=1 Tax=Brachybacterium sacelli TaxID=173364 RepID=A0ABS4X1Y3_9MICO|nr:aminomethyl-transferring glycine dehydrogenase [Brachybacterium sacelli]MBP2382361.1 glycine dehydrogenase [Brachybacterium sacelli]